MITINDKYWTRCFYGIMLFNGRWKVPRKTFSFNGGRHGQIIGKRIGELLIESKAVTRNSSWAMEEQKVSTVQPVRY